jgi:Kef-type K+ transport system membrane component KefB
VTELRGHETGLLLELFAIFLWARIFAEVAEHLRIPAVVGEITAGALLGPNALGLVSPSNFTFSVAELGAVFLLLTVGLETQPRELIRVGPEALRAAVGGVILPFVAGFGYMLLAGFSAHEGTFVAAGMVATSIAVTARVLGDLRALETRAAKIVLGAAVFDDILGMLVLAIVTGLSSTGTIKVFQLGALAVEAIAFAIVMIFVAPKIIHRIRPHVEQFAVSNAPVSLVIAIGLGLSAAAEKIGLAAIIGAFFTGLAFAEFGERWKIHAPLQGVAQFLSPFFFFTIGTQLNIGTFRSGSVLRTALVITVLAILTKILGSGLPLFRTGWRSALQVGWGMVPRAEVGLIVAAIGLQSGLISQASYAVIIFMAITTTLVTPPVLRLLFQESTAVEQQEEPRWQWNRELFSAFLRAVVGFVVCAALSYLSALLFRASSGMEAVPFGFLVVIAITAALLGRGAGIAGTLSAAMIYSIVLFSPIGSWVIRDAAAKTNLGWMILLGISISYFIAKPRPPATEIR